MTKHTRCNADRVRQHLPQIILLLFIIQPLMDILSYWQIELGMSGMLTLLLRSAVLLGTILLGFYLSKHKRLYGALTGIVILLAVLHGWACIRGYNGWGDLVSDLTNYIRFIQIPYFTLCFITFFRDSGEQGYRAAEKGFVINFGIIVAAELFSAVTGTDPHTYANKGIGLLGWFYFANSQSAILSAMVPMVMMQLIRKKNTARLIGGTVICFGVLYLFATRLAYFSIFICAAGLIIVLLLCRKTEKKTIAVLAVGAVVCAAGIGISPMHQNQQASHQVSVQKQLAFDEQVEQTKEQQNTDDPSVYLIPAYEKYLGPMMDRFGAQRVLEAYQYTEDVSILKDWRKMKIIYCRFLLQEAPKEAAVFGMELGDMTWENQVYDVENDLHGIFFLYGAVGLLLFALFLLYFVWIIIRALIKDFRSTMTLEAGAVGIALCTMLLHVYATAGVLRRPNASFYLSVLLAVVYYMVHLRQKLQQSD